MKPSGPGRAQRLTSPGSLSHTILNKLSSIIPIEREAYRILSRLQLQPLRPVLTSQGADVSIGYKDVLTQLKAQAGNSPVLASIIETLVSASSISVGQQTDLPSTALVPRTTSQSSLNPLEVMFNGQWRSISPSSSPAVPIVSLPVIEIVPPQPFTHDGISISPGLAVGKALIWTAWEQDLTIVARSIKTEEIETERLRLIAARDKAIARIETIIDQVGRESELGNVLEMHTMVITSIAKDSLELIPSVLQNAEQVVEQHVNRSLTKLKEQIHILREQGNTENANLFEARIDDIETCAKQLLRALIKPEEEEVPPASTPTILVTPRIMPDHVARIVASKVSIIGFVVEQGSPTSHAAMLAKKYGIPAIVLAKATMLTPNDSVVVLDGTRGALTTNPTETAIKKARAAVTHLAMMRGTIIKEVSGKECETLDGIRVNVAANIDHTDEIPDINTFGGDGNVGLFRTEYLYMNKGTLPTEAELVKELTKAPNIPFVVRIADLGGDKLLPALILAMINGDRERTAFMGLRGMRLYFRNERTTALLMTQIRAILKASATHPQLKMLFPMVAGPNTMKKVLALVEIAKRQLREEALPFNNELKVGAMIEMASAVQVIEVIAQRSSFFSIGTNDLIQYTLGVDRQDGAVASNYDPFHPAILRSVHQTVAAGKKEGIEVSVCGDTAADPLFALFLIGIGINTLSAPPRQMPLIKHLVRSVRQADCENFSQMLLANIPDLEEGESYRAPAERLLTEEFSTQFGTAVISRILGS